MRIFSRFFEFLIFAGSCVLSVFLFLNSVFVIYCFANSLGWEQVPAKVINVQFLRHDDSQGRQDSFERKLVYNYIYDKKEFTSQREHFGVERFFSKPNTDYVEAQQIKIHVDPNSPSESVIYRFSLKTFTMQLILMVVLFGSAYLFRPKWLKNITSH
jgi:hypothetical protein